jgi:hypothetical protein
VNADEWEIGCPFLAMSQRVRSEQGSPLSPCRLTEPGGDPIRLGDQVIDAEPQEQGLLQLAQSGARAGALPGGVSRKWVSKRSCDAGSRHQACPAP